METRKRVALGLVQAGRLDALDAIALVVWPTTKLEGPPAQPAWPVELVEEARRLHREDGLSCPEVAERLVVPYATVKAWLWPKTDRCRGSAPRVRVS